MADACLPLEASVRRGWRESSKRSSASVGADAPFRGIAITPTRRGRTSARRRLRSPREPRRGDRVRHGAIVPAARLAPPHGRRHERANSEGRTSPDAWFLGEQERRARRSSRPSRVTRQRVLPRDCASQPSASRSPTDALLPMQPVASAGPESLLCLVLGGSAGQRLVAVRPTTSSCADCTRRPTGRRRDRSDPAGPPHLGEGGA